MKHNYMIGCNYWASHAGTDMWKQWDATVVREDLRVLTQHGVTCLRVFPNWRDFQPVMPIVAGHGQVREYRLENGAAFTEQDYLDNTMLNHFEEFCDICDEYGVTLIVGLITGFMSGQTFMPTALYGKNLLTDPVALLFEQRFIHGFVTRFRERNTIRAWDLGNECNNLACVNSEEEATAWSVIIANAIRAADPTRPVISGMHGLAPNGVWTIRGQAEACDVLTTHPYPYWVPYADRDPILTMRTALHATFETKFYSAIGGKPCLVEELGTMGPTVCSDEAAAAFMRLNLWSNLIHGAEGVLWWCANEQTMLTHTPYTYQMVELELGLRYADGSPKPVLSETAAVADAIRSLPFDIPACTEDAVCIATRDQEQWGVAFMSYCLAKQAGLNLTYAAENAPLPEASVYLLPSVNGASILPRESYLALVKRVQDGATLYISNDNGLLAEFEALTGLCIEDSHLGGEGTVTMDSCTLPFRRNRTFRVTPTSATVLATDNHGIPAVTVNTVGRGRVIYVNFPLEAMLLNETNWPTKNYCAIYRAVFSDLLAAKAVVTDDPFVGLTLHPDADGSVLCAAINYSAEVRQPKFSTQNGYTMESVLHGNLETLPPFDVCLFRIRK